MSIFDDDDDQYMRDAVLSFLRDHSQQMENSTVGISWGKNQKWQNIAPSDLLIALHIARFHVKLLSNIEGFIRICEKVPSDLLHMPWKSLKLREADFFFLTALILEAFAIRKALEPWLMRQNLAEGRYQDYIYDEYNTLEVFSEKLVRLFGASVSKQLETFHRLAPIFVQALQDYSDDKTQQPELSEYKSRTSSFYLTTSSRLELISDAEDWRHRFFEFEIGISEDGLLPFYFPTKGEELYQRWCFLWLLEASRAQNLPMKFYRREKAISKNHHLLVNPLGSDPRTIKCTPLLERLDDYGYVEGVGYTGLILCGHRRLVTPELVTGAAFLLKRRCAIVISAQEKHQTDYLFQDTDQHLSLGAKLSLIPKASEESDNRQRMGEFLTSLDVAFTG